MRISDRVGVVRRLRLGAGGTLYKKAGEAEYTVDLSKLRHKTRFLVIPGLEYSGYTTLLDAFTNTPVPPISLSSRSRFYGPQLSSLPESIGVWVAEYEKSIALEMAGPNSYLFPLSTDWGRGHSSSGWTQLVKVIYYHTLRLRARLSECTASSHNPRTRVCSSSPHTQAVFLKHAGVATPPKMLRASFCTHLRSAEGVDDELLESCARAMKHQVVTGGSAPGVR